MADITIKSMSEEYVQAVYDLGMSTEQLQVHEDNPAYYSVDSLRKAVKSKNEVCLVALVDGKFAGFALSHINPVFNEAYLSDVALKPEHRGGGLGSQLFNKLEQILKTKGVDWCWALVHEDNILMQEMIEKRGFEKGRKFFFYSRDGH
jgi:ribosomal protein S18 acetylase RimI-like enzyme